MTPSKGICYALLATIVFVNSFAFPNRHSDLIIEQKGPRDVDQNGATDPCPNLFHLVGSYCISKKTIERECLSEGGTVYRYFHKDCGPSTYCQGSQPTDPEPRSARCELDLKRSIRWATNKLLGSSTLQCIGVQNPGVTGADGLGVQADTTAPNANPPMPQEAQLFYQNTSYPIQAMGQSSMNDISGYFIFNYVIDYTQALEFCVNVATIEIGFKIGLLNPRPANMGGLTFTKENRTIYKSFDNVTGIWKEVQLDVEE